MKKLSNEDFIKKCNKIHNSIYTYDKTEPLPFDFYIEYDGIQHYKPIVGGEEGFIKLKERDDIKSKYCKDNNIELYRIGYKDNINNKLKVIINE